MCRRNDHRRAALRPSPRPSPPTRGRGRPCVCRHARLLRDCGSRMSRRPSPSRLRPSTVRKIARPGNTDSHGAVVIWSRASRQHAAPARIGRADAEAEERQRGLGQNGAAHAERGDHQQRPDHVRQQLRRHDAQVAIAERARRLHVALRFQRQRRGARQPAGAGPVGQPERDQQRRPGPVRARP